MISLFIVCYKKFEVATMDSFKTEMDVLNFIKSAKDETVVDSIYSIDCFGDVKSFTLKFNGQFFLEEVVSDNG